MINTDESGGPGVHWLAAMELYDGAFYIYDPLGKKNPRVSSSGFPVEFPGATFYPYESQMDDSNACGYFSLYIADLMRKLVLRLPMAESRDITRMIQREFGKDADRGDEKRVASEFDPE